MRKLRTLTRSNPLRGRSLLWFALGASALLAASGCSKSKTELAVERAKNRKPPAYIRFVNFSSKDLGLRVKSSVLGGIVPAGGSTKFQLTGAGTTKFAVISGGKPVYESSVTIDSGKATSVVTTDKGTKLYDQEARDGQAGQSAIRVILVAGSGPISVDSDGSTLVAKVAPESASDVMSISPGNHTFKVKTSDGKTTSVDGNLTKGDSYTIFVNIDKSGANAVLAGNSPVRHPTAVGGLAGGG